jgi:integrase
MNEEVEAVLRRRLERYGPTGYVFLNEYGRPRKNALALRMRRLRARAGIVADEQGEQFVLYTNRHTFLTKAGAGSTISQSTLMGMVGHTDPRTTARYVPAAQKAVAAAGRRVADGFKAAAG